MREGRKEKKERKEKKKGREREKEEGKGGCAYFSSNRCSLPSGSLMGSIVLVINSERMGKVIGVEV